MLTIARILLTLTVLGYAAVTIKADFNKTHATNPKWTPHARFHVVWQILSYSGVGLIALYLIWSDGPNPIERLYLAAAISAAIYGAFFAAVWWRGRYSAARSMTITAICRSSRHRAEDLALGCQRHRLHGARRYFGGAGCRGGVWRA